MNIDLKRLKPILPLIALIIMGLIAYWLIKEFGLFAYPLIMIMVGIPLLFIKFKD